MADLRSEIANPAAGRPVAEVEAAKVFLDLPAKGTFKASECKMLLPVTFVLASKRNLGLRSRLPEKFITSWAVRGALLLLAKGQLDATECVRAASAALLPLPAVVLLLVLWRRGAGGAG